jgi:uncharacterized membrane protein
MSDEELDRALSQEHEIVPSSGFAGHVMDAVRRETSTPPPIPFPWKWAAPGLATAVALLSAFVLTAKNAAPFMTIDPSMVATLVQGANHVGFAWIGLSLLLAFASVKLSRVGH